MSTNIKSLYIFLSCIFFLFLPILFFVLGEGPERTYLKDGISIITILAFFIVLGQFYLSKINEGVKEIFKLSKIIKIHKIIGYTVLPILLIHPFLIVVPRFVEVGPEPFESFIKMISGFDSLGVILGIIGWLLMLVLGLTSMFREKLNMTYESWKILHGILSMAFIVFATWHAIDMGRHMSMPMIVLIIFIASIAIILLFKSYFFDIKKSKKISKEKEGSIS